MILTSDLHFTDKEEDAYRFRLFEWLAEHYKRTDDKNLIILGDLTDSKDHHSATLVNAIVDNLLQLCDAGMEIFILKGNHDYIDPATPFFKFLGQFQYINFIIEPKNFILGGAMCLFLPHSRSPQEEWKDNRVVKEYRKACDFVFAHESVIGSVTSSGYSMDKGLLPSYFRRFNGRVFSGDIHCPQQVGPVTYVGTPYSIRFNDHYRGRVLQLVSNGDVTELFPDIRNRWTFDISSLAELDKLEMNKGDQIKIRYRLSEEEEGKWNEIRKRIDKFCAKANVELHSLQIVRPERLPLRGKRHKAATLHTYQPADVVKRFSKQRGLTPARKRAALKVIDETS